MWYIAVQIMAFYWWYSEQYVITDYGCFQWLKHGVNPKYNYHALTTQRNVLFIQSIFAYKRVL